MKNTIKSQKNFDFNNAEAVVMPVMIIKYRPKKLSESEYGIVSSKRTFPTAVERNRARRLIRAWLDKCDRPQKFDILFIARKPILETNLTSGVGQMAKMFGKIKRSAKRKRPMAGRV